MAEALYRKYRPQIFEDVVGQEHIERTIKNAVEQDKVSHAYLFCGPRGTGKTTTARLLAKALLCEKGPTSKPDGTCEDCVMIAQGIHPDVYELDAASRTGVENVREEIIGRVQFAPTRRQYKIYIIDEVHMLSTAAFNALLKTLEEPPSHVIFILATTDPQKVPETIHSRCQRFDFHRISAKDISLRLDAICVSEGVEASSEALDLIAHHAEGGMRNALTALEQLIAFGEGKITLAIAEHMLGGINTAKVVDLVHAIASRDVAACFRFTDKLVNEGIDLVQFTREMAKYVRDLYVMSLCDAEVSLGVSDISRSEQTEELAAFGPDRLANMLGVMGDLAAELKVSTNARLSFEVALTRMVRPDSDLTLASLAARIEALEQACALSSHPSAAPSSHVALTALHDNTSDESVRVVARLSGSDNFAAPSSADTLNCGKDTQDVPSTPSESLFDAPLDKGADIHVAHAASEHVALKKLANNLQNTVALQRMWKAVLGELKKNKMAYAVLFINTKISYDAEKHLIVLKFSSENTFAFKAVQKPDVQDVLAAALLHACGQAVPFVFVLEDGACAKQSFKSATKTTTTQDVAAKGISAQNSVATNTLTQNAPDKPSFAPHTFSVQETARDDGISYVEEQVPYEDSDALMYADTPCEYELVHTTQKTKGIPSEAAPKDTSKSIKELQHNLEVMLSQSFGDNVIVKEVKD